MAESVQPDLDARLRRVPVDFILPTGLRVDDAVRVAEDLVASGVHGEATAKVAALSRNSLGSDADRLYGPCCLNTASTCQSLWTTIRDTRCCFVRSATWTSRSASSSGRSTRGSPRDEQDPLDCALVTLLDKRDHLTTPAERDEVEQEMRSVVRNHVALGPLPVVGAPAASASLSFWASVTRSRSSTSGLGSRPQMRPISMDSTQRRVFRTAVRSDRVLTSRRSRPTSTDTSST